MTLTGVVVMAYGTPRRREDLAAYYTDIRRGRPPTDEQLADLAARYDAIGGVSPLAERTERQRTAIAAALEAHRPGEFAVEVGLRHADPSIEAAVRELADRGADRIVGLVLTPHYSSISVAVYLDRAAKASAAAGPVFTGIESWATEPAYVEFLAGEVLRSLETMPAGTAVVFTAHSLPERVRATGDRFPHELRATAEAVAAAARLQRWSVGWQSAGRTPEPWVGPGIGELIDELAADSCAGVVVCPCGFVADHLEVLYDVDIDARRRAERAGLAFTRTAVPNDDPVVMGALARRIVGAAEKCRRDGRL